MSRSGGARSTSSGFRLHANETLPRAGSDQGSHSGPATKSRWSPSGTARTGYVLSSRRGVGVAIEETCRCVSFRPRAVRTDRFGTSCTPTTNLPAADAIWMNEFSSVSVGLLNQPRIGMPRGAAWRIRIVAAVSDGDAGVPFLWVDLKV